MYTNHFYETHKRDGFSQNGEEGLVVAIMSTLGISQGWVCEFGAWNGHFLSNVFALIKDGFRAVLIESDPTKFSDLEVTCKTYPNIIPVLAHVSPNPNNDFLLDKILHRTDIPLDFALLSIDIDSYDYQVWETFVRYRPRVVIIEINSSIDPKRTDYIHENQPGMSGSNFGATLELAKRKHYSFLAHTGNMIFIRDEDAVHFSIPPDPYVCFRTNWII